MKLTRIAVPALALALFIELLPASARAQDCPAEVPASSRDRRTQAKEWFTKAEAAEAKGNQVVAVKAYQCSLKMVPHAFTAFNLARLAEKTGDLELAVESYGAYLKLAPEAQDRAEVEGKITSLTARISALRAEPTPPPPARTEPTPAPEPMPVAAPISEEPPGGGSGGRADRDGPAVSPVVWVLAGGSAAALVGGIVLNLGARSKMDECRSLAPTDKAAAQSACDAAKPRAYASYALIGLGAVAAAVDIALIVTGEKKTDRELSFAPLPGGGAVMGRFRF
jgi:hypothetical protein